MTGIVHVKHITVSLLLISVLVSCNMWKSWFGRETVNLGEYITLEVENPMDSQSPRWIFAQLPDSSKLGGFLPADTLNIVSFRPDIPGEYDVVLERNINGKIEESSYFYEAVIAEDSSLVNHDIPAHLLDTTYTSDTTLTTIPAVANTTATGDQRHYLSKVVAPDQSGAPVKRRSTKSRKTRVISTSRKPSRGNLIPRAAKTYTIQISSWPSLEEAQEASRELLDRYGIDSYIQRAFFRDKDEIYYRLRVGNFQEQTAALDYAKEIQNMTSLPVWVDFVRQEM